MTAGKLVFAMAWSAVALAGCSAGRAPVAAGWDEAPDLVIVADPVDLSVGGATSLTITATNRSGESFDFGQGSSSCWFGVRIVEQRSGQVISFARICTADYAKRRLAPGQAHSETVTWRAQMRVGDEEIDVPPGEYRISAVAAGWASRPVSVTIRR